MRLPLHGAAARELESAFDWYLQREAGVADKFLEAVRAQVERAANFPESGTWLSATPEERNIRRFRVGRFPFSVIIATVADQRLVIAIAHDRRRPGYWQARLHK